MCLAACFQVTQYLRCMKWLALRIKLADPRRLLDDIACSKESPVRLIHRSIVHCIQSSIRRKRFYKYQIDSLLIFLIVFKQKELKERQAFDEDVESVWVFCVRSAKISIACINL